MGDSGSTRIRFRDIKPYEAPASLAELHGPYDGTIDLPHSVRWQPDRLGVNISEIGMRRMAYQALLSEGLVAEQRALMNRDRLIETWTSLHMDSRARNLWESRFSELRDLT